MKPKSPFPDLFKLLRILGMSYHRESNTYRIINVCIVSMTFLAIFVYQANDLVRASSLKLIILRVSLLSVQVFGMLRNLILFLNRATVLDSVQKLEEDKFYEEKSSDVMNNVNRQCNRLIRIMHWINIIGCLTFFIVPQLTKTTENSYPYPQEYELPVDYEAHIWAYPLIYIYSCFAFAYGSSIVVAGHLVQAIILMKLNSKYEILNTALKNIIIDAETDWIQQSDGFRHKKKLKMCIIRRIKACVVQHGKLMRLSKSITKMFSPSMLAQVAISSALICLASYETTQRLRRQSLSTLAMLQYLNYALLDFLVFCGLGEVLKAQTEKLGCSLYLCDWHSHLDIKTLSTYICLLLMISRRPIVLTAGGLYDMNLNTYLAIIKGSYSILTILLNV